MNENLMEVFAACVAALLFGCGNEEPKPSAGSSALSAELSASGAAHHEGGGARAAHPALAPGRIGVSVADAVLAMWPVLDDTSCGVKCFSLDYSKVPAAPNPKFWEYTNGVPLYAIQKLYERTGQAKYLDYVKRFVDTYVDGSGNISYARPYPSGSADNDPTIQDTMQPATLLFGLYQATGEQKYLQAMANARNVFHSIAVNPAGAFWHKPAYPN